MAFDEGCKNIVAMKSLDGEVVPLKRPVTITPEVEVGVCTTERLLSFSLVHNMPFKVSITTTVELNCGLAWRGTSIASGNTLTWPCEKDVAKTKQTLCIRENRSCLYM